MNAFFKLSLAGLTLALAAGPVMADGLLPAGARLVVPGQLTVAYRTDDRPVSFVDDQGRPAGFLVDIETKIADALGLKVEFVATDFASMLPAIRNDLYDTAAFQVLVTPEREEVVAFTTPVGFSQARLVSRKDAPIAEITGAVGKAVAITRGSALIPKLQELAPGVEVREFPNIASSLNALIAGQVDGLFTGLNTAASLVEEHEELTGSQVVSTGHSAFPVAIDNPDLKQALDAVLKKIMLDGTFTRTYAEWISASVPIPDELYAQYPGMPRLETIAK
ncbi:transporter substrate-binding domain-containing protein [Martelella sp. HB161492]|uniref:ABC transporter substrate-binding protein n=1 Tax=Martelella sp. HB161492 TaxID=2720726 RepID=UPI001590A436|nr:transporter substrate-binding domain-containing protein [Martelella sp. HB161492]